MILFTTRLIQELCTSVCGSILECIKQFTVVKCSVAHTDDGLNIGNEDGMFITLPGAVSTRIKVMSK